MPDAASAPAIPLEPDGDLGLRTDALLGRVGESAASVDFFAGETMGVGGGAVPFVGARAEVEMVAEEEEGVMVGFSLMLLALDLDLDGANVFDRSGVAALSVISGPPTR